MNQPQYFQMKKNITVAVDAELYRLNRIKAAETGTTVTSMVRNFLHRNVYGRTPSAELPGHYGDMRAIFALADASEHEFGVADMLPRDQLHDRNAVR